VPFRPPGKKRATNKAKKEHERDKIEGKLFHEERQSTGVSWKKGRGGGVDRRLEGQLFLKYCRSQIELEKRRVASGFSSKQPRIRSETPRQINHPWKKLE